ncbi:MAG: amino acid ABC transporter substrate-binding protein [Candidatus Dormibacteraeota bacterium]|uniref:Amino acid ABC transporter substrate-binding protein n=1 Tax=Candidatus Dormiibacter inghamiae TaxID=3127013 RepID=A0A934K5X6_9BACT|nr:amino acid ABC transporter substrate-binding protein [Candidatus Dormibacteraeota bacterium]MBJ7604899.1 amino acid ABC transporter substrate-binding protein [Candidatus Dormibacteraeota bacterium]
MRARSVLSALVSLFALTVAACGGSAGSSGGSQTGQDLVIGVPMSITGVQAKEGGLAKQGYDLWLDWINAQGGVNANGTKHKVVLKYEDDQSKPDISAQLTTKLITQDKAQLLLGPYGSATTASDAVVAEKNGIPMVEANGAAQAIFNNGYRYTFGVLSPANKYLQGVIDMAATLNPKPSTMAMLSADDSFSLEVAKAAQEYATAKGFNVVYTDRYPNGSTNLSGLVANAKAKNPEMLLNSGHLAEAVAINKAAKDLRLDAKLYAYSVGPSTPDFVNSLGTDSHYVYGGSQWTPQVKYKPSFYLSVPDYVAAYKKKYATSDDPDYHVAESTAACLALQKAIENAGSLKPDKVRDALASLDVITFFGRIKFDSRGINTYKPMVVEQIQTDGKHHTVFPPDVADAKPQYPTPTWSSR